MKEIFNQRDCLSQEEIKQYLSKQLDEDARFEVENHLTDCPFCADAVEGFASIENFEEAEVALKQMDEQFSQQANVKPLPIKPKSSLRLFFLRAAAIFLALALPVAVVMYWGESKEQRLFAEYFSPYPAGFNYAERTTDSSQMAQEPFFRALQLYEKQQYNETLVLLREHFKSSPNDPQASFYAGVCYLKTGKTKRAAEELEKVLISTPSSHSLDATWYLALAKLKQGDTERARSLLLALTQTGSYYNKKAAELLSTF